MTDAEILESTYFDLCTIKRKEKVKDPNTGITSTIEVIKATDIKCALSKKDNQIVSQNEVGILVYSHLLFTGPKVDVLAGDTIEVISLGHTYSFVSGEPFRYVSHQEVYLNLKEKV